MYASLPPLSQRSSSLPLHILDLSNELLQLISTHLLNGDIKNLRLAGSHRLATNCLPVISRIYISPNYKNIEVARAVAKHPVFRQGVKEIVWDEARLEEYLECHERTEDDEAQVSTDIGDFVEASGSNTYWEDELGLSLFEARTGREPDPDYVEMSVEENFALYNSLYEEQEVITNAGLEVKELQFALSNFPNLQRVTVSTDVHHLAMRTRNNTTPMIRACPPTFSYPLPWPWGQYNGRQDVHRTWSDIRDDYLGVSAVLAALAHCERAVPELVVQVGEDAVGIPHQLFEFPSTDFNNFQNICRGLTRLDLVVSMRSFNLFTGLRDIPAAGLLTQALSQAVSLQHFSLKTNAAIIASQDYDPEYTWPDFLLAIPVSRWPALRFLEIGKMITSADSLINFLKNVPKGTKEVAFTKLDVLDAAWAKILARFRDELGWRSQKPGVRIEIELQGAQYKRIRIKDEVGSFFDGTGECPFRELSRGDKVKAGFGTLVDELGVEDDEPWLGIID